MARGAKRVFKKFSLVQGMPLSDDGYAQLRADCTRWAQWREQRSKGNIGFAVDDPRQQEDVDIENEIAMKVKKLYKSIKAANRKKAKEAQADAAAAAAASAATSATNSVASDRDPADELISDSEDEKEIDPFEQEIHEAFSAYSQKQRISTNQIRSALIQVLNEAVDAEVISKCLDSLEPYDPVASTQSLGTLISNGSKANLDGLDFHQFRRLYSLVVGAMNQPASSSGTSRYSGEDDGSVGEHFQKSMSHEQLYWQSSQGSIAFESLPASALPLDLREVDWSTADEGTSASTVPLLGDYPAGSAIGVARKMKQRTRGT